jgi:formate dehydrogenase iron-sulfur subunit
MTEGKSIFIDTTKCTACRGCQIACKQWNQRGTEKTTIQGSHQNPPDLSHNTWKLVRFNELPGEEVKWYFFPDQCRHCLQPPCEVVANEKAKGAVNVDEKMGMVLYNSKVKIKPADFKEIREACPYDIPRMNPASGIMGKCTMCFDRTREGLVPACVKTCPTGAMSFGDRKEILEKANKRLEVVKGKYQDAMLTDPGDVRVFYLLIDERKKYHKFAAAEKPAGMTRKTALNRILEPLKDFLLITG